MGGSGKGVGEVGIGSKVAGIGGAETIGPKSEFVEEGISVFRGEWIVEGEIGDGELLREEVDNKGTLGIV